MQPFLYRPTRSLHLFWHSAVMQLTSFRKKSLNLACLYFRVLLLTQCACSCDGVEGIHLLADGLRSSQTGVHVCSTITVWSPSGKLSPLSSERSKGFFCQLTRSRVSYVISVWNKGHSDWMHEWVDCGVFPICKLAQCDHFHEFALSSTQHDHHLLPGASPADGAVTLCSRLLPDTGCGY